MSKPFDATLKQLLDTFAIDWVGWLSTRIGLPPNINVDPLDVDLSTVQLSADKVFRLQPPARGLLHIEPQSSWDGNLPSRLLLYNSLLFERYEEPVFTVAVLLRRQAHSPGITGELVRCHEDGREYLRFRYSVIRVWELSAEELISGRIGAMPLALLTDDAFGSLSEWVNRMDRRLTSEKVPEETRKLLLTSSYILSGLRYTRLEIHNAFLRARGMRESTSYQAILEEGREEVMQRWTTARQDDLIEILLERFGIVPDQVIERIRNVTDSDRLHAGIRKAMRVAVPLDLAL